MIKNEDKHYKKGKKRHDDKGKDRKDDNIKGHTRLQREVTGMMTV
jgi:hypothetical protein